MININKLEINTIATEIAVDIDTTIGNIFTKVLVWDIYSYKDNAKAIDLTTSLAAVDETEVFLITAADLGVSKIIGTYFIEFTTNEATDNIILGLVSNFIPYHECILNKLLNSSIENCNLVEVGCGGISNTLFLNAQLDTLYTSILLGLYDEAIKISKSLDISCVICNTCPSYADTLLANNLGFKVINNVITRL